MSEVNECRGRGRGEWMSKVNECRGRGRGDFYSLVSDGCSVCTVKCRG